MTEMQSNIDNQFTDEMNSENSDHALCNAEVEIGRASCRERV